MVRSFAAYIEQQSYARPVPPLQEHHLWALERCIETQRALAARTEAVNPGDPYAALMLHDDIDALEELRVHLRRKVA